MGPVQRGSMKAIRAALGEREYTALGFRDLVEADRAALQRFAAG